MIKYYTDQHNVDEDLIAISLHGGMWNSIGSDGIARRNLQDRVDLTGGDVASSNMKNSHSYTDFHDVDEDKATIPSLGEHWRGQVYAGLHCRHIDWLPSTLGNMVASKKK